MRLALAHLRRNRRVVLLFAVMVLLPAAIFSVLIIRALQGDRVAAAQQKVEHRRQVVRLVDMDLNAWLLSTAPGSAMSKAAVRFEWQDDRLVFPDFQLSLPVTDTARPQPLQTMPATDQPTARSLVDFYYPRILVFLRDVKSRAQYFQRLHAVMVRLPDGRTGYVLDTAQISAHVSQRLAELAAATDVHATFSIADVRDNRLTAGGEALTLEDYPFFQVVFQDETNDASEIRSHAFAYAMTCLVALTILGSVFLYRAVSQEVRLSQLQTDFVSAVSHEFRSPLSSIMALSERLASARVNDPSKLSEYHRVIGRDARRLSALVTRLLEFAQIEDGRKAYLLEQVDLVATARDAIDACADPARPHRLHLCGEGAAPLWVHADPVAVQHCIQNLIENAMKYSPPDSPITITCAAGNGSHVIDVSDRGMGIPLSEQSRIFEKFYRGSQASALDVQGVGIGLALVAHVMKSHGGLVVVESEPGQGSRFRLSLPRAEA
jgi:two-component system phosphate regulon sensor histidine kinase PhoR